MDGERKEMPRVPGVTGTADQPHRDEEGNPIFAPEGIAVMDIETGRMLREEHVKDESLSRTADDIDLYRER